MFKITLNTAAIVYIFVIVTSLYDAFNKLLHAPFINNNETVQSNMDNAEEDVYSEYEKENYALLKKAYEALENLMY